MRRKMIAAILVVIVSAFSFARGEAQVVVSDHTTHSTTSTALTTNFQTTTVGSTAWASTLSAPAGTTVSWLLSYTNSTNQPVNKLVLYSSIPANQTLVPGSVTWFDGSYPNGYVLNDTGLFNEGVQIGAVAPQVNGFVRYRTQSDVATACGTTSSANAYFEIDGTTVSYTASFSTPACVATTPPVTSATTPTTTVPVTDHATHTTTTAETNSSTPNVLETVTDHTAHTSTSTVNTATSADTLATPEASPTVTDHSSHASTTADTARSSDINTSTTDLAATTHSTHETSATTTDKSTQETSSATHNDHVANALAESATNTTSHAGHTIPATGGSPLWLMLGAGSIGYIVHLMITQRRQRAMTTYGL